jgi:hypothetical protein
MCTFQWKIDKHVHFTLKLIIGEDGAFPTRLAVLFLIVANFGLFASYVAERTCLRAAMGDSTLSSESFPLSQYKRPIILF